MAVCGRCFLCQRKFECVPGRHCESCHETPEEEPVALSSAWLPGGWKICVSCMKLVGKTEIGDAIAGVLRFAHAKNGESL